MRQNLKKGTWITHIVPACQHLKSSERRSRACVVELQVTIILFVCVKYV